MLTTPVIRCLKQQLDGNIEIHYLTKQPFTAILTNNPYLSKIHAINNNINEVIPQLKAEEFHYIVDLHKNIRSKSVISKLNVLSFTFDKLNFQKWLYTTFKINKLPNIHIVDRYLQAVAPLGIENDNKGLDFFITKEDEVTDLPKTQLTGYVSIAIGTQHYTKCLPTEKIIKLCNLIQQPIVLLGGKDDEQKANEIIKSTTNKLVYSGCGKYTINQSAFIVKNSKLLITPDTGLMHIAAAFNVQLISVWGNTVPAFGMYPYLPKEKYTIIENNALSCRPCSKIGYAACPKKHFNCMNSLDMSEIAALVC